MTYYCKLKFLNISILPIFLFGYSWFYDFVFAFFSALESPLLETWEIVLIVAAIIVFLLLIIIVILVVS